MSKWEPKTLHGVALLQKPGPPSSDSHYGYQEDMSPVKQEPRYDCLYGPLKYEGKVIHCPQPDYDRRDFLEHPYECYGEWLAGIRKDRGRRVTDSVRRGFGGR